VLLRVVIENGNGVAIADAPVVEMDGTVPSCRVLLDGS